VIHVQAPSVTVFRADPGHANGVGIMVVPGGGHRMLIWTNEGVLRACALNRFGVTAFVLKYRSAREAGSTYDIARDAAADARRAVRWVRSHAKDYGVDPKRPSRRINTLPPRCPKLVVLAGPPVRRQQDRIIGPKS
jgi:acetyl esterase/lipase